MKRPAPCGRATCEHEPGTQVIRFVFPCGKSERIDYAKKPRPKQLSASACAQMVSWWNKGGTTAPCPRHCARRN